MCVLFYLFFFFISSTATGQYQYVSYPYRFVCVFGVLEHGLNEFWSIRSKEGYLLPDDFGKQLRVFNVDPTDPGKSQS